MTVKNEDIFCMVGHWLIAPGNGYLGSGYGGRHVALATQEGPVNDQTSREFMIKLREDIPALAGKPISIVKSNRSITVTIGSDSETYGLQA